MPTQLGAVTILRFPRDDDEFDSLLERLVGEIDAYTHSAPELLEARLRAFYPSAVVHRQDPLGGLFPARIAWYVYRDGSPVSI
jgi:hypothetical protein